MTASVADMHRYPELDCRTLQVALAERLGVAYARVVVGPGSVSVLQGLVLLAARRGGRALLADPDFEVYRAQADAAGTTGAWRRCPPTPAWSSSPTPTTPPARV